MLDALRRNHPADFFKHAQNQDNFLSLPQCALDYAKNGITSIAEVLKITASLDDVAPTHHLGG